MPSWFTRELWPGDIGHDVGQAQAALGLPQTRVMDELTLQHVRGIQVVHRLVVTGIVDQATADAIGERHRVRAGLAPSWFPDELDRGWELLGSRDPDALRRFQGDRGLPPTGQIDQQTAILLGE